MGLLSNPVIAGLLSGGPNAVRAREQQRLAAMLPRGQGGMMGAPSGVVRQDSGLGQGIAGLGEGLAAIGEMRAQQQAQEQAKTALERALGMSSGPDAIKQNVAAGGQAGPTVAAAEGMTRTNPMNLSPGVIQAARMSYDAGDYGGGLQLVRQGLTAGGGKSVNIMNPTTGEVGTIREGEPVPAGFALAANLSPQPKQDTMTGPQKDALALGLEVGSPEFADYIRQRTLPKPANNSVTVQLPSEAPRQGKYEEARGTQGAEYFGKITNSADTARQENTAIGRVLSLSDRFETGALSNFKVTGGKVAQAFNVPESVREFINLPNDKEIGAAEAIRNVASAFVFSGLQNFSGAISEGERAYIEGVVPGLSTSPEGIRQMAAIRKRINDRAILRERMALDWEQKRAQEGKNGGLVARDADGRTFRQYWGDYVQNNALFPEDEREAIAGLATDAYINPAFVDPSQVRDINGKRYIKIGDAWFEG